MKPLLSLALLMCSAAFASACRTIDFSKLPNGKELKGGDYLSNEWFSAHGLILSSSGGLGDKPRLFNTSDVGNSKYGDPDLGSPNQRCPNPGPGKGEGGEPDSLGANCSPLGNVLIIQEDNDRPEIPDDNVDGGVINFQFNTPLHFKTIGLLDVDYASKLRISFIQKEPEDFPIPKLGDNSFQVVNIDEDGAYKLELHLGRSGAIAFFNFCYSIGDGSIGSDCMRDSDCNTDFCFSGDDSQGDAGICVCNQADDTGCETGEECTYEDGSGYFCKKSGEKLGIDEPCMKDSECATDMCWADWFIDAEQPGLCKCNVSTNNGCPADKDCISAVIPGSPPGCFLPVGAACVLGNECFSGSCFDGYCAACDEATGYPCDYYDEVCLFDGDASHYCQAVLGKSCRYLAGCPFGVSQYLPCWKEFPLHSPGICVCDENTNAGCAGGRTCAVRPGTFNTPPSCFALPDEPCVSNEDCLSHSCGDDGRCTCNINTNYPCADDEVCAYEDSPNPGYPYPLPTHACKKCDVPNAIDGCYRNIPLICSDGCEYPDECSATKVGFNTRLDCSFSNKFEAGPGGNLYKAFEKRGITWTESNNAVISLADKCGMQAHLATITSLEEDVFVHELGRDFHKYKNPTSFWVGGIQNVNSPTFEEPGGGWEWVNDEGIIPTETHPDSDAYSNWGPDEPNDFRNQPQNPQHLPENHMTVGRLDKTASDSEGKATGWNDEFEGPSVRGYVVEVEVTPTVFYRGCDTEVDNLRLPSASNDCPPGQISTLIEGCAEYNADPILDDCIFYITNKLKTAGIITEEERVSIVTCDLV